VARGRFGSLGGHKIMWDTLTWVKGGRGRRRMLDYGARGLATTRGQDPGTVVALVRGAG
jgi:hypothetical protein